MAELGQFQSDAGRTAVAVILAVGTHGSSIAGTPRRADRESAEGVPLIPSDAGARARKGTR
jgi:hypothetical protein